MVDYAMLNAGQPGLLTAIPESLANLSALTALSLNGKQLTEISDVATDKRLCPAARIGRPGIVIDSERSDHHLSDLAVRDDSGVGAGVDQRVRHPLC